MNSPERPRGNPSGGSELLLAEYKALRDEIHVRIQQQQLLITVTVTALGAIGAVAIDSKSYDLLLLVPLITTTFGLMLVEHSRVISALGDYINYELGGENTSTEDLGRWERSPQRAATAIGSKVPLVLQTVFLFGLCPIVAVIAALTSSDVKGGEDWLAVGGLALVALPAIAVDFSSVKVITDRRARGKRELSADPEDS